MQAFLRDHAGWLIAATVALVGGLAGLVRLTWVLARQPLLGQVHSARERTEALQDQIASLERERHLLSIPGLKDARDAALLLIEEKESEVEESRRLKGELEQALQSAIAARKADQVLILGLRQRLSAATEDLQIRQKEQTAVSSITRILNEAIQRRAEAERQKEEVEANTRWFELRKHERADEEIHQIVRNTLPTPPEKLDEVVKYRVQEAPREVTSVWVRGDELRKVFRSHGWLEVAPFKMYAIGTIMGLLPFPTNGNRTFFCGGDYETLTVYEGGNPRGTLVILATYMDGSLRPVAKWFADCESHNPTVREWIEGHRVHRDMSTF